MREIIKPGIALFVIALTAAALLGLINYITEPAITANTLAARKAAAAEVLPLGPGGAFAEEVPVESGGGVTGYSAGTSGAGTVGWAVSVTAKGYGGDVAMLVGVDASGVVTGVKILSHKETPGLGANAAAGWADQFVGKSGGLTVVKGAAGEGEIQTITAATITSRAVTNGVNDVLRFCESELKGGGGQ
ncbi:MAG: RnfABCDGE type electron transport complex subunit G [Clostridiales bacterium]|nr:RnfABCDGE type electron transport complex subunit G [Clostridiales bacterium]